MTDIHLRDCIPRVDQTGPSGLLDSARRSGWAVAPEPVLTPDGAAELRATFLELHGPPGSGWHNSWNTLDRNYRGRSWAAIEHALGDRLRATLPGFEPFSFVFLCKWPGEDSYLYLHQDWMYVVEAHDVRTYSVMVALEDIEEANGRPYMVTASHRLHSMIRGTHLYHSWEDHKGRLAARAEPVDLPVGTAAIWDSALVHYSVANLTDVPRIAVAVGMRPVGVQLVHYRRTGPDRAARYLVDGTFFSRGDPYSLMDGPPAFPLDREVPTEEWHLDGPQLDAALDDLLART